MKLLMELTAFCIIWKVHRPCQASKKTSLTAFPMAACTTPLEGKNEYLVAVGSLETAVVQDTAAAQEMSEPYMAINSFSQTFAVIFEKYTFL
jgi:hypothetical protein